MAVGNRNGRCHGCVKSVDCTWFYLARGLLYPRQSQSLNQNGNRNINLNLSPCFSLYRFPAIYTAVRSAFSSPFFDLHINAYDIVSATIPFSFSLFIHTLTEIASGNATVECDRL